MKLAPVLALSTCLILNSTAQAASELIELRYRNAAEMLPLIDNVLDGQGKASAYGNQVLINASTEKIDEVRQLLSQLDQAPRRLLISVDSREGSQARNQGFGVNGHLSAGNVEIIAGQGPVNGRDQVRIINRSTNNRSGGVQQIQATEGYPALIQVGQSVPMTSTSIGPYGQVYQNTQYRDINQGFYVTAYVSGDIVQLDISTNNDRLNPHKPNVINTQRADTRINGRLGQWISLGGTSQSYQSNSTGLTRQYSTGGYNDSQLQIKVEALD